MKKGWELKTLDEICVKASSNVSQNQLADEKGKFPIYGAGGFIKNVSFYHQDKEYVSIIKDGAGIGRISLLPAFSSVIGTLQYLIPKENINIRYFYYFLLSIDFLKHKNGSTIPHIYFKDYSVEKILVAPLSEQKRIVGILDKVFADIAKAKENAEKNLQNARELFESYLQNIFAHPGDGWEEKKLGEVCDFEGGSQPPKDEFVYKEMDGYIRLIQIRDYKTDNKKVYIPIVKAKRFCDESDIMIGRYGPPVFQILRGIKGAYNVALMKTVPKKEKITKEFIYFYLKHRDLQQYIINLSQRAVGQTGISKEDLEVYPIYFPSKEKQRKVTDSINLLSISNKRLEEIYQQKLADLEELKKSILQKAFNGEL